MGCTPGMQGCIGRACGHRDWVEGYRQELERQQIVAENVSLGYKTELDEWLADHPLPTLKEWMLHRERAPEPLTNVKPWAWDNDVWAIHQGEWNDEKWAQYQEEQAMAAQPRDEWADDSERLTNWDQKAEQARARELAELDRQAEKAAETVEMRSYLAVDHDVPTVQEVRLSNERGLLGAAMASEAGVQALGVVRDEFYSPFHQNVAKAILDQAAAGAPHDARTIETVLRSRKAFDLPSFADDAPVDTRPYGPYHPAIKGGQPYQQWSMPSPEVPSQLPAHLDPDKALVPRELVQYGLETWDSSAVPDQAVHYAQEIRKYHRADYLTQVAAKLSQSVQGAMEVGEDPGYEMLEASQELVNIPPKLGADLQPTKDYISRDWVDTRQARPLEVPSEAKTVTLADLGLPEKPVLRSIPKAVASA